MRVDLLPAEAAHRVLEAMGTFVFAESDRLTVEHQRARRERAHRGDDFGEAVGDLVEVAGVHPHFVVPPVHLDPRAVELPLDRRGSGGFERGRDVLGGGREHGLDRPQQLEAHGRERVDTVRECEAGSDAQVTAEHRGPPHDRERHVGRARDRIGHHPFERALAQLAEEEASEEVGLGLGRAA